MGALKAKVSGSWLTVGSGPTLPPGGTTGQVLTKSSATDYATAWGTNQPILANNTNLQGYKADGTTPQNLIGVTPANHVLIGQGLTGGTLHVLLPNAVQLAALRTDGTTPQHLLSVSPTSNDVYLGYAAVGDLHIGNAIAGAKAIYLDGAAVATADLTVNGLFAAMGSGIRIAQDTKFESSSGRWIAYDRSSDGYMLYAHNTNCKFNEASGQSYFQRDVQIAGVLYKAGVGPYTHPDYVFEHAYRAKIELFANAHGAATYAGLMPLPEVEAYTRETLRLPGPPRKDTYDLFARGDELLAEVERLYLHAFDHERRLRALENR